MSPDSASRDWESLLRGPGNHPAEQESGPAGLARRIARALPEGELQSVVAGLNAEQARLGADRYEAALTRARAAVERNELDTARTEVEAALRIDFVRWEAHRLLGVINERAGDTSSALRCYVTAMHLGWESEEATQAIKRLR